MYGCVCIPVHVHMILYSTKISGRVNFGKQLFLSFDEENIGKFTIV